MVQKVAETIIPLTELGIVLTPGEPIPLITLTPDVGGIVQNRTILRDKVVNIGFVPATITVAGVATPVSVSLPFQEHTDCPGACPEDTLIEAPLQVEATIIQPIPLVAVGGVLPGVAAAVFKVILRTTITVVRPLIAKTHHGAFDCLQDVNTNRCETTTPPTISFPFTPPADGGA
jgi:hypothetical protein